MTPGQLSRYPITEEMVERAIDAMVNETGGMWVRTFLEPVARAALRAGLAAREDIERPERCWTLVSGGEGELPVVEAGPMLVREEVRVREDTERPDSLPLPAGWRRVGCPVCGMVARFPDGRTETPRCAHNGQGPVGGDDIYPAFTPMGTVAVVVRDTEQEHER